MSLQQCNAVDVMRAAVQLAGGDDVLGKSDKGLHPHDIDAFWLQRKLSKHYDDPMLAQTRAGEVLAILKVCFCDGDRDVPRMRRRR